MHRLCSAKRWLWEAGFEGRGARGVERREIPERDLSQLFSKWAGLQGCLVTLSGHQVRVDEGAADLRDLERRYR